ncbi:MAG: CAP domain-containing protein, partial [Rhodobacterales bacterium]|nr:CAP domain-containing protein [Rhodobacterales bacterium]MDX5412428.1 CAP domain-containing protein [Rhodobacterales bacterium]
MTITAAEQYLIELVNRARLDPLAEAQRYGISLNQNLAAGTISATQKQVLAPNTALEAAAQAHSEWLLATGTFSHTGANGSTVTQRIEAAGYTFSGRWSNGENLAFSASTAPIDLGQKIAAHHQGLFLSAGHRRNILEDSFREIGVAQVKAPFTWNGVRYEHTSMLTEKFALSGSAVFVTGVFYEDRDGDGFYSIGEGRSGSAAQGDSHVLSAEAGGYALAVAPAASVMVTLGS